MTNFKKYYLHTASTKKFIGGQKGGETGEDDNKTSDDNDDNDNNKTSKIVDNRPEIVDNTSDDAESSVDPDSVTSANNNESVKEQAFGANNAILEDVPTKETNIKVDTSLFLVTNKESFDPKNIILSKDGELIDNFTTDEESAKLIIGSCENYPNKDKLKYIHQFKVKSEIGKLYKQNIYDKMDINDASDFLNQPANKDYRGIAYIDDGKSNAKFMLYDPGQSLEYVSTQSCVGPRLFQKQTYNFTTV